MENPAIDYEALCREAGWVKASELLADLPPVVEAFKLMYEDAWYDFENSLKDPEEEGAAQFFNIEAPEFFYLPSDGWKTLAENNGLIAED